MTFTFSTSQAIAMIMLFFSIGLLWGVYFEREHRQEGFLRMQRVSCG